MYGFGIRTPTADIMTCVGDSTIKSPQILELSGIGDRAVLEPLGVPVHVDLPSVGTNVQEHITHNAMAFRECILGALCVESASVLTPSAI